MIVGVAIKQNGTVYGLGKPKRHHHVIQHMVDNEKISPPIIGEQGFYNEEGEFLNRYEALKVALETGQITKHDHQTQLFSEDLW